VKGILRDTVRHQRCQGSSDICLRATGRADANICEVDHFLRQFEDQFLNLSNQFSSTSSLTAMVKSEHRAEENLVASMDDGRAE
jgi:hypothetical protein